MRTRGEIKTKLQPKLMAVSTSTYFTPTRIESSIDDSYLLVAASKPWSEVKKGFVTATVANQEYYDYPDNCESESVFKISVDGDSKYKEWIFEDYLKKVEEEPTCEDKIFAEFGRQIFIHPTPTTSGSANLIFWGIMQSAALTSDGDVTIFTDWADVVNEAIMLYAYADLVQNIDDAKAKSAIDKADKIINQTFKKVSDRLQRKHKDEPQFEVPDFFGTSGASGIGSFSRNN